MDTLALWHTIKNIFHFIIIFQCLFFAVYMVSQPRKQRRSSLILALFMCVILVNEISGVIYHFEELYGYIANRFPQLFFLLFPIRYLSIPILYLFVRSFIRESDRFKRSDVLHFLLFSLVFGRFLSYVLIHSPADLTERIHYYGTMLSLTEHYFYISLTFIQFALYAAFSITLLSQYRRRLESQYSSVTHHNLEWLTFIVYGFISWQSLSYTNTVLDVIWGAAIPQPVYITIYIASEISFLIFLSIMFLKRLRQPDDVSSVANGNNNGRKYEKVPLSDGIKHEYKNRLVQYMDTHKPYLEPSISLKELAANIDIPPHHLSQVLNTMLEKNFFDFINTYRINESIRLLSENTFQQKTVLEILYQSGFNSKSVFNTAFKKHTGMTPTQFRKQHVS